MYCVQNISSKSDYDNLNVNDVVACSYYATKYTSFQIVVEPLKVENIEKNIEKFDIRSINRNISNKPCDNVMKVFDLKTLVKDCNVRHNNISPTIDDNVEFNNYGRLYHKSYLAVDEFKICSKIRLKDLNTIFGFSSVDGEWETASILIDTAANKVFWYESAISSSTLPENPKYSEDINFNWNVDDYYNIELIRSGLNITFKLIDLKRNIIYEQTKQFRRFHGSVAFCTTIGKLNLMQFDFYCALYNYCDSLVLGDSITEGLSMGTSDISVRWASKLRDIFFKGSTVVSGVGWGKTGDVIKCIQNLFMIGYRFNYIIVMIGTNQSGNEEQFNNWKTGILSIYNMIIDSGAKPIIVCPPLHNNSNEYIIAMRNFILEQGWDTIRMDIATSINNDGSTFNQSFSTDGTHFNANGNLAMYERAVHDLEFLI
ncbi:MAG: SGNH/GDSL hydrolase family protein [Clostridia bacterium]|nr:SGNH/GDSL hydrolase family protein [Clostridia bacterium]